MSGAKQDPRARRAEAIRVRVMDLMSPRTRGEWTAALLRTSMFDALPGKPLTQGEVTAALGVLRRRGQVRYDGPRRVWRLA